MVPIKTSTISVTLALSSSKLLEYFSKSCTRVVNYWYELLAESLISLVSDKTTLGEELTLANIFVWQENFTSS